MTWRPSRKDREGLLHAFNRTTSQLPVYDPVSAREHGLLATRYRLSPPNLLSCCRLVEVTLDAFVSVLLITRDDGARLPTELQRLSGDLAQCARDYEVILIDNESTDGSVDVFGELTGEAGIPNLQVFALAKAVEPDVATCVGLEHALGDFVVIAEMGSITIDSLNGLLREAERGVDVVIANDTRRSEGGLAYRLFKGMFNRVYRALAGIDLGRDVPAQQLLSRRVVNSILSNPQPATAYRHLPYAGGFRRANLVYSTDRALRRRRDLWMSVDRSLRLLTITTRVPLRIVTLMCVFGAAANLVYSTYAVMVGLTDPAVEPGWLSITLQQSGMFMLLSIVLLVLSEYILQVGSVAWGGSGYIIGQEFASRRIGPMIQPNVLQARGPFGVESSESDRTK